MSWTLVYEKKPLNTNAERRGNRFARADHVKEWRGAFYWLTKKAKVPRMRWITITVEPSQARGRLADTAACNPSVKAAIDGIVDAGIIPDDTGDYVRMITFLPVLRGPDQLTVTIEGEPDAKSVA